MAATGGKKLKFYENMLFFFWFVSKELYEKLFWLFDNNFISISVVMLEVENEKIMMHKGVREVSLLAGREL